MFNWNDSLALNEFDGLATMVMDGREVGVRLPCRVTISLSGIWTINRRLTVGPAPRTGAACLRVVGSESDQFIETREFLVPVGGSITLTPPGHKDEE
jgi:hypothetical protein